MNGIHPPSLFGLFLLCTMAGCRTQAPGLPGVSEQINGEWIRVDSLASHGARLPIALAAGDTNRDGLPDLLAGSAIYLNPGGDLTGTWTRIEVGREIERTTLVEVDGDGHPDLIGLASSDIYWLEALDPEGIQWSSMKVAEAPVSVEAIVYATFDDMSRAWALVTPDSLYRLDIPEEPDENAWSLSRFARDAFPYGSFSANPIYVDLDRDGDPDSAGIDTVGVLFIRRNDASRMP